MSQRVKRKHSVSSELPAALLVTHTGQLMLQSWMMLARVRGEVVDTQGEVTQHEEEEERRHGRWARSLSSRRGAGERGGAAGALGLRPLLAFLLPASKF